MTENRPPFPSIKLHRPRSVPGWIVRPRLLARLDQALQKPVALVSAPAGFGKTTLVSQWLDNCRLPNAWLQLDENDHEIPVFLSGVVAALRQLFPSCLQKTTGLLLALGSVPLEAWTSALVDDLELLEGMPFVLALDDYHLVANPAIDLLLADVLRCDPQPMHLILAARRSPALSFSRLTVQRLVVDIRPADLRFTGSETSLYFQQTAHLPLSDSDIHNLQVKTEGWAAGLALAAISLREDVSPEELIAHLEGPDSQFSDYLLDQVFNSQPAEIQDFLLKTATFNQFCASMLSEAFESGQSEAEIQAMLERVEEAQLFLTPLDAQHSFYRYHHIFRQMLLSRQRFHFSPAQIAQFHRRAAAWLTRQGQTDEALSYLLAVRDWTGAAQLVEGQLCALLNAEDYQGIKRRLGYFPEDFIAARPGLLLMQVWVAHFAWRQALVVQLAARIQALLDAVPPAGEMEFCSQPAPGFEVIPPEVIQAQVWMQQGLVYYLTNQGSQAVQLTRRAVELIPETWKFVRGNAMIYLGLSLFMEGQYSQAVELVHREYECLPDPGSTYGARLLFCLSVIYLLNGDLELCRQTTEQLLHTALAHNLLLNQGWAYYMLGRVYQEWNQLDLAAENYLQGVEERFTSNMVTVIESIAGYAYLLQILDRGQQARQFLDSLGQIHGEQTSVTPPQLLALEAWLNLENGSPEQARRWAEAFNTPIDHQQVIWYHIPHLYQIKILMETSRPESCGTVDRLLDEAQALAERTHNTFTLVRVLALRAAWLARCGQAPAAQQTLERALRLGRPGWFIHAFVKQGPEMLDLLQAAARRQMNVTGMGAPDMGGYIAAILAAFSSTNQARSNAKDRDQIKTLLTEREMEVLELLARRLSINEISSQLFISPSTVQQHTHHIYRKLNVANKRQAVASAIELGLLPSDR
jgi:LuxR family transcriptional regulator, maltose regulon positive regulatory protein